MKIIMHRLGWYVATAHIGNVVVMVGFGRTHAEAICNAFKDYQVIKSLK